jgi:hypothetical protein
LDAFAEDRKADQKRSEVYNENKQARRMADYAQRMKELDIKRARMDIEAREKELELRRKQTEADERLALAQFQREREKEQHELQMFRLRAQYSSVAFTATGVSEPQASGSVAAPNAAVAPFGTQQPFLEGFGDYGLKCDVSLYSAGFPLIILQRESSFHSMIPRLSLFAFCHTHGAWSSNSEF